MEGVASQIPLAMEKTMYDIRCDTQFISRDEHTYIMILKFPV